MSRHPFPSMLLACAAAALLGLVPAPAAGMQAREEPPAPDAPPSGGRARAGASQPAGEPRSRPPLPNRANDLLPAWLRVRGEFRERIEGFSGAGFREGQDDLYALSRLRLSATISPSRRLSFEAQLQDARVAGKAVGPPGAPFRAPVDLRVAFADIGGAAAPVSLRAGRQELAYGEQRLVGHVGWLNAARTFDAAKLTFRRRAFQADAFVASVVRTLDDAFDRSGNGNRFAGAYVTIPRLVAGGAPAASAASGPTAVTPRYYVDALEPYVFWRRDTNVRGETGLVGDLAQATAGVRLAGRLPASFDYGVELALQRGSLGAEDVSAWAGHWQLRHSLAAPGAPRLTAEYNYASGDRDPADGVRGTFDQLYPTPHDKYGLADQVGWKNVHHARTGVEIAPLRSLPLAVNYHTWWLAERRDALYTAGGAVLARVPPGARSRHVGHEVDVQVSRPVTPHLQLSAGYAHVFAGAFLKEATPGASYSHPYVMVTYVFLADR